MDPSPDAVVEPDEPDLNEVLDSVDSALSDVEAALRRLDDGTWDRCRVCDATIDLDTLVADPTRATCAEHA